MSLKGHSGLWMASYSFLQSFSKLTKYCTMKKKIIATKNCKKLKKLMIKNLNWGLQWNLHEFSVVQWSAISQFALLNKKADSFVRRHQMTKTAPGFDRLFSLCCGFVFLNFKEAVRLNFLAKSVKLPFQCPLACFFMKPDQMHRDNCMPINIFFNDCYKEITFCIAVLLLKILQIMITSFYQMIDFCLVWTK